MKRKNLTTLPLRLPSNRMRMNQQTCMNFLSWLIAFFEVKIWFMCSHRPHLSFRLTSLPCFLISNRITYTTYAHPLLKRLSSLSFCLVIFLNSNFWCYLYCYYEMSAWVKCNEIYSDFLSYDILLNCYAILFCIRVCVSVSMSIFLRYVSVVFAYCTQYIFPFSNNDSCHFHAFSRFLKLHS